MRVIAGSYRGRKLSPVEGKDVRPTSDRLRETLFNILAPRMRGGRFLDLCAGSGSVGIEAISRGASEVVFIESSRRACSIIEANLRTLGIESGARLINRDVLFALQQITGASAHFDIVFFDPPYASELYDQVMNQLPTGNLLAAGSIVVVEHRSKHQLAPAYSNLATYRQLNQGESALSFYKFEADLERLPPTSDF
ncbi:MAG: 16S rRNA (guanine(966)-N(2))-methyltransferase RsmD [Acidobacteriota bacterium]